MTGSFSQSVNRNNYPVLTNTRIDFQDTISIAGTIYQGQDIIKSGLVLAFNLADSTYRYTLTDSTGHYQFHYLPKGQYEVRVFGGKEIYKPITLSKTESEFNLYEEDKTTNIEDTTLVSQLFIGPNTFSEILIITGNSTTETVFKILDQYGKVLSEIKPDTLKTISIHTECGQKIQNISNLCSPYFISKTEFCTFASWN